jgi:AcrR family transcriptional regulator
MTTLSDQDTPVDTGQGSMHRALLEAGLQQAREAGPDGVVLSEAARRVGVTPDAAHAHFPDRESLVRAVYSASQAALAHAIEARLATVGENVADPVERARGRLKAVGAGYLGFAQTEPGLFRTAFTVPEDLRRTTSPQNAGGSGRTPYQLLGSVLDEWVAVGLLPADRRIGAEVLAWAPVHGLAVLAVDGPLRSIDPRDLQRIMGSVLDMVTNGLQPR